MAGKGDVFVFVKIYIIYVYLIYVNTNTRKTTIVITNHIWITTMVYINPNAISSSPHLYDGMDDATSPLSKTAPSS